jgi:hypothetical protein
MHVMLTQAQSRAPISARLVANMMQTAGANRMLPPNCLCFRHVNNPHRYCDRGPPRFSGELKLHVSSGTLLIVYTRSKVRHCQPAVQSISPGPHSGVMLTDNPR